MKIYEVLHKDKILMGEFQHDAKSRIYSRKRFKHEWLTKNGERYYFKQCLPKKELYIGDVVAPYILEKVGLERDDYCIYYLVVMETPKGVKPGVLSKSYIQKNDFQLSYYDISLFSFCIDHGIDYQNVVDDKINGREEESQIRLFEESIKKNPGEYLVSVDQMMKDIERYCAYNNLQADMGEIEYKLKRMIISDFFLCQLDRHRGNTEFKIRNRKLTMCPIFDHERCLSIGAIGKLNSNKIPIYTGLSDIGSQSSEYNQESSNMAQSGIFDAGKFALSLKQHANFLEESPMFKNNGLMACDIVVECLRDEKLRELTYNFMCLDISNTLNDFENEYLAFDKMLKGSMRGQYEYMQEKFYETYKMIEEVMSKNKSINAKFEAMTKQFEKPFKVVEKRLNDRKQNDQKKPNKEKSDEEYLWGLLMGK